MKKMPPLPKEDIQLFRDAITGAKALTQDSHVPERPKQQPKKSATLANSRAESHLFYFSDLYEGVFPEGSQLSFVQCGEDPHLPKRLKRDEFQPAVVLDLHGLNQEQAKNEIAGLLAYCQQQHFNCACIVHGKGLGILAKRVPNWLVQHPNVRAFHTAPTKWGRDGALLVLLKTPD